MPLIHRIITGAVVLAALLACKQSDDTGKASADTTTTEAPARSAEPEKETYSFDRTGVKWCDIMLKTAECTTPRYKKKKDRVEAGAVWRMRSKKWQDMDEDAAGAECKKMYDGAKDYAPKYDDGLMVSCYKD